VCVVFLSVGDLLVTSRLPTGKNTKHTDDIHTRPHTA
jgi:hypothetical protein